MLGGQSAFSQLLSIVRPTLPAPEELQAEFAEIIASGMLTRGKHLRAFEEACAQHLGVQHAVAVSSCTTGLMLAYQGLKLTGEVIVPEKNWFIWPEFAISNRGNTAEAAISTAMLRLATVSDTQFVGKPFKRWFWRRQPFS